MSSTSVITVAAALLLCVTATLFLVSSDVQSADDEGQFAIRGAGLINCALYTRERSARGDVYRMTAAWADGYITGINQYAPQTYDLLSFESTELLMAILDEHCQTNPADPVFGVLTSLFQKLWPDRVTSKSDKITITIAEREVSHYVELVERIQRKLQAEGFYEGTVSGEYSPQTMEAVTLFQQSIGFDTTGFPDQLTLWRLMRSEQDAASSQQ